MTTRTKLGSFLLVDGAQLAIADLAVPLPDAAPGWLTHVYDAGAAAVSPFLVNIAAASVDGGDQMMALFTALQPQLHASLIDATLSHEALTQHLRRFIMIRTEAGKAYTLRFADCTVLPILATVLTPAQWAALVGPIARWCVHGLDGALQTLPAADPAVYPATTPLVLTVEQLAALAEAGAPSVMLAHLLDINHGVALPGSPAEQHRWASDARLLWRSAGNLDEIVLRWLTSAALATAGRILQQPHLPGLLGGADPGAIRDGLRLAVTEHHERLQRISNRNTT
jgi:hypothetical protein